MNTPVKMTYVGGYGRSASTLIDSTTAQQSGALSTGELWMLPHRTPEHECSCGLQLGECGAWSDVVSHAGPSSRQSMLLESHLALFIPLPMLRRLAGRSSSGRPSYQEYWTNSIGAACSAQETDSVVDSSKTTRRTAGRALAIQASGAADVVSIIIPVRQIGEVIESRRAAFERMKRPLVLVGVRTRAGRRIAILTAALVARRLGVPAIRVATADAIAANGPEQVNDPRSHQVAGNRRRLAS